MRFAIIQFPGSNCDRDCLFALRDSIGVEAELIWHKETSLDGFDAVVVPGGFSFGDYLRCGAIARFSPIMPAVKAFAAAGGLVIGICNGFQILCEAGLLPGVLLRNRDLHFLCTHVDLEVISTDSPFTSAFTPGETLRVPIAHGEGAYFADAATLAELEAGDRILLKYVGANPNGSVANIAGICNAERNVFGLMPHPERACELRLGSADGRGFFDSMLMALGATPAGAA